MPTVTFIDTSALFALIDRADRNHAQAAATLPELRLTGLVTHNYVVVESVALVQRRLGQRPLRDLIDGLLAVTRVAFVDPGLHAAALATLLAADRRGVSFVDRVSFEFMRRGEISTAFAFDDDFAEQGFRLVPGGS